MIRSAKMNAITPPKLMPPFHSTAASGTLPIEQTKLSTATSGPTIGPQNFASAGGRSRKKRCQNESGTQAAIAPAISRPRTRSRRIAAHSMTKTCDDRGEPLRDSSRRQKRALACDGHVHRGVALHRPGEPAFGLLAGLSSSRSRRNSRNSRASTTIMIGPPTNSASGELPAHQQGQDDAELDDEVGGGDLEGHRRGEVRALAEQRAGQRHGGVGARRRRGAQPGGDGQRTRAGRRRAAARSSTCATTACTTAESANPRISAHGISQNIQKAKESASPRLVRTATSIAKLYERLRTCADRSVPGGANVAVPGVTGSIHARAAHPHPRAQPKSSVGALYIADYDEDDLTPGVAVLQVADGGWGLWSRVRPVDGRCDLAGLDELLEGDHVLVVFLGHQYSKLLAHEGGEQERPELAIIAAKPTSACLTSDDDERPFGGEGAPESRQRRVPADVEDQVVALLAARRSPRACSR